MNGDGVVGDGVEDLCVVRPIVRHQPEDVIESLLAATVFVADQLRFYRLLLPIFIVVNVCKAHWV